MKRESQDLGEEGVERREKVTNNFKRYISRGWPRRCVIQRKKQCTHQPGTLIMNFDRFSLYAII